MSALYFPAPYKISHFLKPRSIKKPGDRGYEEERVAAEEDYEIIKSLYDIETNELEVPYA